MTTIQKAPRVANEASVVPAELSPLVQVVPAGQLEELRAIIQSIAAEDATVRASLVRDPNGTVSELIRLNTQGVYELSDSINVQVFRDSESTLNIVIPSSDKVEGIGGDIAEFSRALESDPNLRSAFDAAPRETLEQFMRDGEGGNFDLPSDKEINVVVEQCDQLCVVLSEGTGTRLDLVADSEIGAPSEFDPHMSCFTCECFTKKDCFTGTCFTASDCFTWSSTGKC
jgi:hypothetical protein